jgi:hypothetical protein
MQPSRQAIEIVDKWWPVADTQPRKTEQAVTDFNLAMLNCQAELIIFHVANGDVAEDRIQPAYKTVLDLRSRGASV